MPRTVGVEEEMILVDIRTGRPQSVSRAILGKAAAALGEDPAATVGVVPRGAVEGEFQQQQLEIHTSPVADLGALQEELRHWRQQASALAREVHASVAALGTSPMPVEPRAVPSPRYEQMQELLGLTGRHHLTCGCHVHVGIESDEEGVGVLDRVRVWLPVLLAMSSNSPYWQGEDSSYASYRSQAFSMWPTYGPTDVFGDAAGYRAAVDALLATDAALDEGMIYWTARLAAGYPTVEIRVADVCLDVADTVLVAALCRGLVETTAREWARGEAVPDVSTSMLRIAMWQAARYGVEDHLIDPRSMRPAPARDVVGALVSYVWAALGDDDRRLVEAGVERLWSRGSGATRQRRTMERTGQLLDVVAHAVRITAGHDE